MAAIEFGLHPDARQEYLDALGWYIERSADVGLSFQREVSRSIQLVVQSPERWPYVEGDTQHVRVHRFPYLLYYRQVTDNRIEILAIAHGRRKPGYWRYRRKREGAGP